MERVQESKARASLRQVVHELREALLEVGFLHLQSGRAALVLDGLHVSLDLRDVLEQAERGSVHPLLLELPRLAESLLLGLDDLDPAFRIWLLARRQAFHDRLIRGLESELRRDGVTGDACRRAAQGILNLDPTHEEACRSIMRISAKSGDTIAALRAYERLWQVLSEDYDTEPTAATQQLVAEIKLGLYEPQLDIPKPSARLAAAAAIAPRIALMVEAFALKGVGPEQAHLAEGFRHDLIARLIRFREWFVVDGLTTPALEATGARVAARYRIGARAYSVSEQIIMVLTLAEQESGIFVWSEHLKLKLENWFDTQQHVLRRITIALNMQVSSARLARIAAEPDITLAGYDRWLRCQQMVLSFSPNDWERAFHLVNDMTAISPGFAPAFSHLAQLDNLAHIIRPGTRRNQERELRSLANARRAVEIDPTDSRSQLHLGWSLTMMGRHAQAGVHMGLALELNPDNSWVLMSLALFYAFDGQHADSYLLGQQSLQMTLSPSRTHWGYEVTNAYLRGDDTAALNACDRAGDVIRTLQAWRAAALYNLRRQREAEAAAQRFCEMVSANWFGQEQPTAETMTRWLLHLYPIRRQEDWERLRAGVAGAGLPAAGTAHGDWYHETF